MISERQARQNHRAGCPEFPWEYTTCISSPNSAAVDLAGAGHGRQVGGRPGEGAVGDGLRLGEVS